jgi:hypothetical protein
MTAAQPPGGDGDAVQHAWVSRVLPAVAVAAVGAAVWGVTLLLGVLAHIPSVLRAHPVANVPGSASWRSAWPPTLTASPACMARAAARTPTG